MPNNNQTIEYKQLLDNGEPFYPLVGKSSYSEWIGYEEIGTAQPSYGQWIGFVEVDGSAPSRDFVVPVENGGTGITDFGTIYSAEWTASSSSATNVAVSGSIDLPTGTYIITAHCPTVNVTNWAFAINDANVSATAVLDDKFQVAVVSYVELVLLHKFTSPAKIRILSAASVAATFSNLTRGGLYAMRIK